MVLATLILLLLVPPAWSLDNSVTVHNWNGGGSGEARHARSTLQSARPFTIHRIFAQGEIPQYPRPRVNAVTVEGWQADVKQRWRDGTATCRISSVSDANGWVKVTCNNHGFQNLEQVTIAGADSLDGTYTIAEPTLDTFLLRGVISGGPSALESATATGPGPGSVKQAYVSFHADVPAGGAIRVDFVNSAEPCAEGDQAACEAAGLAQDAMLGFNRGWGFRLDVSAGGGSKGADAVAMLAAGKWRYWLRGPVVTQVVVEDLTPEDMASFGWHLADGTMADRPGDQYRSLNPRFVLTFYSQWPGVRGEIILENSWASRMQDQVYDVSIHTGGSSSGAAYSARNVRHYALTRWHKTFWDGATPGEVRFDYNFQYLVHSRALMPYDTSLRPSSRSIDSWLKAFLASDRGEIMGNAIITKNMFEGEEEAGVLQGFDAGYAASGDPRLRDVLFGTNLRDADAQPVIGGGGTSAVPSHVPVYIRYPAVSNNYCPLSCAAGAAHQTYGRFYSIETHPNARNFNQWNMPNSARVGDRADRRGWIFSTTHMWNNSYVPWLVTGDLYYLEDLIAWSSWLALNPNPGPGDYQRHGHWGYHNEIALELRGSAWGTSMLAHTAFATPDGWPEKELITRLVETQFAVLEGQIGITDGWFGPGYPCSTAGYRPAIDINAWTLSGYNTNNGDWCNRWFWGLRQVWGTDSGSNTQMKRNPLKLWDRGASALAAPAEGLDSTRARRASSMYQFHYKYAAVFRVKWFRFPFADHVLREAAKFFINMAVHPNGNPWLLTGYRFPIRTQAQPRQEIVEATRGRPTVLTVIGHGLQPGDEIAICCGQGPWAGLNQPLSVGNLGRRVQSVLDENRFTLDVNSATWPEFPRGRLYIVKAGDAWVPATLAEARLGYIDPNRSTPGGSAGNVTSGYPHYALNVSALLAGYQDADPLEGASMPRTGWEAYQWFRRNIPFQELRPDNLKWSFAPAEILNVSVNAGDIEAIIEWVAPTPQPSKVAITDASAFPSSSDESDSVVPASSREQSHRLTGLTPSTTYRFRITQGAARHEGVFTTPAAGQGLRLRTRPTQGSTRAAALPESTFREVSSVGIAAVLGLLVATGIHARMSLRRR